MAHDGIDRDVCQFLLSLPIMLYASRRPKAIMLHDGQADVVGSISMAGIEHRRRARRGGAEAPAADGAQRRRRPWRSSPAPGSDYRSEAVAV
jgi:hypothetical protein